MQSQEIHLIGLRYLKSKGTWALYLLAKKDLIIIYVSKTSDSHLNIDGLTHLRARAKIDSQLRRCDEEALSFHLPTQLTP